MKLSRVLTDSYGGQWESFPCPTDTLEDYGHIIWTTDTPPTLENLKDLGVFPTPFDLQAAEPLRLLRVERNRLLAESDWWASSDLTMSAKRKSYRQALRDLPASASPSFDESGQLSGVMWPEIPD
jgi:hypothetical protein